MPLRIKITDAMVEAAMAELQRQAELAGFPPPTEEDAPDQWSEMRTVVRSVLAAAARAVPERK